MAYARHLHARVSKTSPRALACCDLCGKVVNHDTLRWDTQWQGPRLVKTGFLRCYSCIDEPQPQLRTFIIPPDPVSIQDPRPGEYAGMVISSAVYVAGAISGTANLVAGLSIIIGEGTIAGIGSSLAGTGSLLSGPSVISGIGTVASSGNTLIGFPMPYTYP